MSTLKFTAFGGEVPRLTKRDLPENYAQTALNLFADSQEFRPLATDSATTPITIAAADDVVRTLYRYPTTSTDMGGSPLQTALVRSTIVDDTYDRVYSSTLSSEPAEYPPSILESNKGVLVPALRKLGVAYPTHPITMTPAATGDALLMPNEVTGFRSSLLDTIRGILLEAVEAYQFNAAFDLGSRAGFRVSPDDPTGTTWQRIFTFTESPVSWNTYNGRSVDRFLWTTAGIDVPFYQDSPGVKTFHLDFPAFGWLRRVKADTTVQENKLKALVVPNTSDRVLSDADIAALFAVARKTMPIDPADNDNPELVAIATQMGTAYVKHVNYLEEGFGADVSPQVGYQLIAQAYTDLTSGVSALAAYYQQLSNANFDVAVLGYYEATNIPGKVPEGTVEIKEVRYYTHTLVNQYGEESKPYLPGDGNSDTDLPFIECNQAETATIYLNGGTLPAGVTSAWKWRLYRSAAGADAANFFLVAEVPITTLSFVDLRRTPSLNEQLQTTTWFPPPTHTTGGTRYLRGLTQMPGQFLAGFVDNVVYFSEPLHPYAWPPQYAIPLNDDVVAQAVFGLTLVVLTKGRPVYINGNSPESLSRVDLESIEMCVSARSVVPVTGGVVFASQNGLCIATQSGIVNMTESLYTRDEWEALNPKTMVCAEHNGVIYFTKPATGNMGALHVKSGKLVTFDLAATALFSDYANGDFYAALPPATGQVAKAVKIQQGGAKRTAKWRSKRIVLPAEAGFAWLAVEGEQSPSAPLNVNIYGYYINDSGTEVAVQLLTDKASGAYSAAVTNTKPMRVTTGRYKDYEVELQGQCRVTSVVFASSTAELKGVN